jgi:hypothetical protein
MGRTVRTNEFRMGRVPQFGIAAIVYRYTHMYVDRRFVSGPRVVRARCWSR